MAQAIIVRGLPTEYSSQKPTNVVFSIAFVDSRLPHGPMPKPPQKVQKAQWAPKATKDPADTSGAGGVKHNRDHLLGFFEVMKTGQEEEVKLPPDSPVLGIQTAEREEPIVETPPVRPQRKARSGKRSDSDVGYPQSPMGSMSLPPAAAASFMVTLCPTWGLGGTLRLSNIPSGIDATNLLNRLNRHFKGYVDFIYVPGDATDPHAILNCRTLEAAGGLLAGLNGMKVSICLPGAQFLGGDNELKVEQLNLDQLAAVDKTVQDKKAAMQEKAEAFLVDENGITREMPTGQTMSAEAPAFYDENVIWSTALRRQIEYYFTFDNLCGDGYLRSHMDKNLWAPLVLILNFPKVAQLGATPEDVWNAMQDSDTVEVDYTCYYIRPKDKELRKKLPKIPGQGSGKQNNRKGS